MSNVCACMVWGLTSSSIDDRALALSANNTNDTSFKDQGPLPGMVLLCYPVYLIQH